MVSVDLIREIVGIFGNVIALALFLSPVPTFIKICKKGSVEQFSSIPYLATLLNCMLWMVYGLPWVTPNGMLVLTINGAGTTIELIYVLIFIFNSKGPKKLRVVLILLGEFVFVGGVAALDLLLAKTHERRALIIGVLCVFFGSMMYAAPLSVMKLVIQTKSVEYLPLTLSLVSFVNAVCWTAYALIKFDPFMTIPNGLGVLFAATQLIMHVMYHKSTKMQLEARKKNGEVGMSEVLVTGDNKALKAPESDHET